MAEAEENTGLIEPSGSGENGLDPSSMNTEDNSLSPAPDVTYDATILESQKQSSEQQQQDLGKEKDSEEVGIEEGEESANQKDVTESSAVQEKAVKFENGEREQQAEQGDSTKEEEKQEDEWMDILGSGELKKKVLHPGGGVETRPTPQCQINIRTKGQLDNGTVVDKHQAVPFTLGDGDVIQAWDLAVSLMEVGEVALVKTSPRFAYGNQGRSPDVPANTSITYELELLDVQAPVDFSKVSEKDLITLIDRKRIRGNELFQRKDFQLAINSYDKALKLIESYITGQGTEALPSTVSDMHVRCLNNLAAAFLKVEMYKESQGACQKVLEKEPNNVKALFRYGKVLAIQGELDSAVTHLQKALDLNPGERAIQVELQKAQKKKGKVEKEEREMYKRMVEGTQQKAKSSSENKKPSKVDRWGPLPYLAVAGLVASIGITLAYFLTQRQN